MTRFLLGMLTGGLLMFAALPLLEEKAQDPLPSEPSLHRETGRDAEDPAPEMVRLEGSPARPAAEAPPATEAPEAPEAEALPEGVIVLGPGEGARLASGEVVSGDLATAADVIAHDIWRGNGAVLGCPHGAAPATIPSDFRFRLLDQNDLLGRIRDAPLECPAETLTVLAQRREQPGFGFVRDREGRTWKVWAVEVTREPVVVERRVHLRREEVPAQSGGGQAELPRIVALPSVPFDQERLKEQMARTGGLPEMYPHIGRALLRSFVGIDPVPMGLGLGVHQSVLFEAPLDGLIQTQAHVGIAAMRGLGPNAKVSLQHHSACLVEGDVAGTVLVEDHAFLYVRGNVLGTVKVDRHATVRIDGDLRGTLVLKYQARALLLGGLSGTLGLREASHARLFLNQALSEADLLRFPGPTENSFCTLFVPRSDLPDGTHESKGGWAEVRVGGDWWRTLER